MLERNSASTTDTTPTPESAVVATLEACSRMIHLRESVSCNADFMTNRGYPIGNANGTATLMIRAGKQDNLHLLKASSGSDTGWDIESIPQHFSFPEQTLSSQYGDTGYSYCGVSQPAKSGEETWLFSVGLNDSGQLAIFTYRCGSANKLLDSKPSQMWQELPLDYHLPGSLIQLHLQVIAHGDALPILLAWVLNGTEQGQHYYGLWQVPFADDNTLWKPLRNTVGAGQNALIDTGVGGPAVLYIITRQADSEGLDDGLYLDHYPFNSTPISLMPDMSCSDLIDAQLAVTDVSGQSVKVFIYLPYGVHAGIYEIALNEGNKVTKIYATDVPIRIYVDISCGRTYLFFYDQYGELYAMHQNDAGKFDEPIALGVISNNFTVARMKRGQTDIFFLASPTSNTLLV